MYKLLNYCSSLLLLVLFSCSKSNEADLQGRSGGPNTGSCDTANMKFATNIVPILEANCKSCHNTARATAGVITENYSGVKMIADNGLLLGVITHASGFSPMPQGKPKLAACDINKIIAWIAQGTKNN